jgi:hypothetical protein
VGLGWRFQRFGDAFLKAFSGAGIIFCRLGSMNHLIKNLWYSYQLGRLKKRLALLEAKRDALEKEEATHIAQLVAQVGESWSMIESCLDHLCLSLSVLNQITAQPPFFPVSLKAKIAFVRKSHRDPTLASIASEGLYIADTISSLKEARHDFVHGRIRRDRKPLEPVKLIRHIYNESGWTVRHATYSREQIVKFCDDCMNLIEHIHAHTDAIIEIATAQLPQQ